jgi:tetratricopeptide (TPR) repeat protein
MLIHVRPLLTPGRRLVLVMAVALASLATITVLLASVHNEARARLANGHAAEGDRLAARGELAAAVAQYRAALSLERGRFDVEQSLALTLLALGRTGEAESYLTELLDREPASGPLNRGMARILAKRDEDLPARVFYQRAVYGEWPATDGDGRLETRFELLEHLERRGAREEMLAALLQLQGDLRPDQTAAIRRVADLFVEFGASQSAIDLLRTGAAAAPRDVELLAQLAGTEREAGQTAAARQSLRQALSLAPDRRDLRERLLVLNRILALDPTLPELRLVTRTRRARELLAAVAAHVRACADATAAPEDAALMVDVDRQLRRRAAVDAAAAEEELALAVRVWNELPPCQTRTPEGRALAQVVRRVASLGGTPA